jgi:uncharacterized membrane protein
MKKTKIIIIVAVIIVFILGLITAFSQKQTISGMSQEAGKIVTDKFKEEGINWKKIFVESDRIVVAYVQSENFTEDELFSNWLYIMVLVAQNSTESVNQIVIECDFENGEKLEAKASVLDVMAFSNKEITTEQILPLIYVTPLTKGPII